MPDWLDLKQYIKKIIEMKQTIKKQQEEIKELKSEIIGLNSQLDEVGGY